MGSRGKAPGLAAPPATHPRLVAFAQAQQREGAVDVGFGDRPGGVDVGAVEVGEAGDAAEAEGGGGFVFEDFQQPDDARRAVGGQGVEVEAADDDEVGAQRDRLEDIGAAAEAGSNIKNRIM